MWSIAISADGEYIAAGSIDKKVYLFDKAGDDDGFLPAPSLAVSVAAVAVIALFRPRKP